MRVLIVTPSDRRRAALIGCIANVPGMEAVADASDAYAAREQIVVHRPDTIALELDLPGLNGLSFVEKLMQFYPMRAVLFSDSVKIDDHVVSRARSLGAAVLDYGGMGPPASLLARDIVRALRSLSQPSQSPVAQAAGEKHVVHGRRGAHDGRLLVIGASTGGTRAIECVLRGLPTQGLPGIVITQHMPAEFTPAFAASLADSTSREVREARDGDSVDSDVVLLAPGGAHTSVRWRGDRYYVRVESGAPVRGHQPSVDVLFQSAAKYAGRSGVGVLLTGMGSDGARGLLAMRRSGASTVAQGPKSCVVFGMPRAAAEMGAVTTLTELPAIPAVILKLLDRTPQKRGRAA